RFNEDAAGVALAKQPANGPLDLLHFSAALGEGNEVPELAQLRSEGKAKVPAMGRVQRTVAQAMIGALEGNNTRLARGQKRRLKRCLYGLESRVAKDRFPRGLADFPG